MTRLSLLPVRAALSLAPILVPAAAPAQTRPAAVATAALDWSLSAQVQAMPQFAARLPHQPSVYASPRTRAPPPPPGGKVFPLN